MVDLLDSISAEQNKSIIQSTTYRNHILIITVSERIREEIGLQDADIYVDFLNADSDEKATEIAICWLPKGAAQHEGRIEHLNHDDLIRFFERYTLFETRCDQEKLIKWIAKKSGTELSKLS